MNPPTPTHTYRETLIEWNDGLFLNEKEGWIRIDGNFRPVAGRVTEQLIDHAVLLLILRMLLAYGYKASVCVLERYFVHP